MHPDSDGPVRTQHLGLPSGVGLAEGIARVLVEMLAHIQYCASCAGPYPVEAVHEFRKAIRRSRALLRLLRRSLPEEVYDQAQRALREMNRATSGLRDLDVVLGTLHGLPLVDEASRATEAYIARLAQSADSPARDAVLGDLAAPLAREFERVLEALPRKVRRRAPAAGVRRTYRQARRDMRATARRKSDEALHDWRKRTKELRYQVELFVDGMDQRKVRILQERLDQMTTLLGEIVDLLVLQERVRELDKADPYRQLVFDAIDEQRARLERQALALGKKLFAPKPDRFVGWLMRASKRGHARALE